MSFWLTRVGSLLAGGGIIWAVYTATKDLKLGENGLRDAANHIMAQTGPMEICGAGVILWLIGKWRSSTRAA
jgi:hypothetical protein